MYEQIFCYKIRLLQKGEHVWSGFQATEGKENISCPQSIWQLRYSIESRSKRGLGLKKASVAIISNHHGACVHSLRGIYFSNSKIQASSVSFLKQIPCAYSPNITLCCFAMFGKRANIHNKKCFSTKEEHVWSGFQDTEINSNTYCPQSIW